MSETALVPLSKISKALEQAKTFEDFRKVRVMAKMGLNALKASRDARIDDRNDLAEYVLRAEKGMGSILKQSKKDGGRQKQGGDKKSKSHDAILISPKLSEIGITPSQASRYQSIDDVPDEQFDQVIQDTKQAREEVTQSLLLKTAKKEKKKKRQTEAKEAAANLPASALWNLTDAQEVIKCDALITDPPYGILNEEWEPAQLEQFTREWAERWDECGADFCLIFWSQEHLWTGRQWFDESLCNYTFCQLLIWHYPNNKKPQSLAGFKQTWEPVFFYRRKDSDKQILTARAIRSGHGQPGDGGD